MIQTPEPPKIVFWAPAAGPKGLYVALKGVRSALSNRWSWQYRDDGINPSPHRVWKGTVTWVEIDPLTGNMILDPIEDGIVAINHLMAPLKDGGHGFFKSGIPLLETRPDQEFLDFHEHDHVEAVDRYETPKVLNHFHRSEP